MDNPITPTPPAQSTPPQPATDNASLDEVLATLDRQMGEATGSKEQTPPPTAPPTPIPTTPPPPPIPNTPMPTIEEKPIAPSAQPTSPTPQPIEMTHEPQTTPTPVVESPQFSVPEVLVEPQKETPTSTTPPAPPHKGMGNGIKVIAGVLVLGVLVGGLVLANLAVRKPQNIRPHASTACTPGTVDCSKCTTAGFGSICSDSSVWGGCEGVHACGYSNPGSCKTVQDCYNLGYSGSSIVCLNNICSATTSTGTETFVGCGSNGVPDPADAATTACQNCYQEYDNSGNKTGVVCRNELTSCGSKITCQAVAASATPVTGCTACNTPACANQYNPQNPTENDCYLPPGGGACTKAGWCGTGATSTFTNGIAYCQDNNGTPYPLPGVVIQLVGHDEYDSKTTTYTSQTTDANGKVTFTGLSTYPNQWFEGFMFANGWGTGSHPFANFSQWANLKVPGTNQLYSQLVVGDTHNSMFENCATTSSDWLCSGYYNGTPCGGWYCSNWSPSSITQTWQAPSPASYLSPHSYAFQDYNPNNYLMAFHFSNCGGTSSSPTPSPTPTPTPTASSSPTPSPTPTSAPTPTPLPPPLCLAINISPSTPVLGKQVTATCDQVTGATGYEFRYKLTSAGTTGALDPISVGSNISQSLNVSMYDTYTMQCRPCIGNQISTIGLFNPTNETFYLRNSNNSGYADITIPLASSGTPITGDWYGNGTTLYGLYTQSGSTGTFSLQGSGTTTFTQVNFANTTANTVPITGDWTGDGITKVGIYDKQYSVFGLRNTLTSGSADNIFVLGSPNKNYTPLTGDWSGLGHTSVGIYDPTTFTFYLKNDNSTGYADITFVLNPNRPGDKLIPITGDWTGDGKTKVGFYDQTNSVFYLRNSLSTGAPDTAFTYGLAGWLPITGKWTKLCSQWGSW